MLKGIPLWIGAMLLVPVAAPVLSQTSLQYQEPFGDVGGQPFLLEIPEDAKVREVAVYINADKSVAGIEMRYEEQPNGERKTTNFVGRRVGQPIILTLGSAEQLLELELGYVQGGGLTNLVVAHNNGAIGLPGEPNPTQRLTKRMDPGGEFAGLTIRADSERIYALGMIVRPGAAPIATQQSGPWGQNQAQQAVEGPAPWTQNQGNPAPSQGAAAPQQAPWNTAQAQQPAQTQWQNSDPSATSSVPAPWANNTQQAATSAAQPAPPWANAQGSAPQTSPQQSAPPPPPWQQPSAPQPAATPPWQSGSSQQQAANQNAGQFGQAVAQAVNPADQYVGAWVESGVTFQRKGDGVETPELWNAPRTIILAKNGQSGMTLGYHERPELFISLTRRNDTSFSGNGVTVNFSESGGSQYARITSAQSGLGGTFEPARVADGVLSTERFSESVRAERDNRRGLFNQGGLTSSWNNNFYSYDGLDVDLFDHLRGRKVQIFKQPGNFDYAIEDNLNLGLPYGLRGFKTPRSTSRQTEALLTNASTFQDSMSVNFGGGIAAPQGGFSSKTTYEKTTGAREKKSALDAIGIARIERYVLVMDKPNLVLANNFRRAMESFINNPSNPQSIINTYGSHYANAITYGGLGKAEKTMSSQEIGKFVSEKVSVQASGSVKVVSLEGGFSLANSSSDTKSSMFSQNEFVAVGGSGSMSASGWTVSDRDTVPVRYDLRPLSDLLSPLYFPSEGDLRRTSAVFAARDVLSKAITAHMASGPTFPDENVGPRIFRIDVHSLQCLDKGHDPTDGISVSGAISLVYYGDSGVETVRLFDKPKPIPMLCTKAEGAGIKLGQQITVVTSRNTPESRKSGFGSVSIFPVKLTEADDNIFDPDDPIEDPRGGDVQRKLSDLATGQKQFLTFGTGQWAPRLRLEYTVTELK
ncbi:MAG: MAC/perforin domain-containing protein [Erythrobacter sp.]